MKSGKRIGSRSRRAVILAGLMAAVMVGCGSSGDEQGISGSGTEQTDDGEIIEIPGGQELAADYTTVKGLSAAPRIYIAVVLKDLDSPYWAAVRKGAEKAVDDINSEMGYTGDDRVRLTVDGVNGTGEDNVDSQIDIIDSVLAENPSALCLAVIDRESCTAQIEAAKESDIPVVILDSGAESGNVDAVCMTDNRGAAAEAAVHLCEEIGGNGQIAVFAHSESSETSRERVAGFCEKVQADYPEAEIVKIAYDEEDTGLPICETLEAYPNLGGIFCTSSGVTEKVLKKPEKAGNSRVRVAGFDADEDKIEEIRSGQLFGTICQNPRGMGYVSVAASLRALSGEKVDPYIDTGYVWLDRNNLDQEENQKFLYDFG